MQNTIKLAQIREYLTRISSEVIMSNRVNKTDVNLETEGILAKIFSILFNTQIESANLKYKMNYEGIDLVDENGEYAFQITSDNSSEKVADTLSKYTKYKHFERFKKLKIVMIGDKKTKVYKTSTEKFESLIDASLNLNMKMMCGI